jgi:hypothetical protein
VGIGWMTQENVKTMIEKLDLVPLEGEGGMYRYTYAGAPDLNGRSVYSAIYYLLTEHSFSHMHQLDADEIYHFYMGDSLELLLLYPDGKAECRVLGCDLAQGEVPQILVPAGCWQGSRVIQGGKYALVGTTMAPAYDAEKYVHGDSEKLCELYPEAADKIRQRCGNAVAQ